jgi:hypothetical protein
MIKPDSEIQNRVLVLFGEHRESPLAPFDESHFLDYLVDPPNSLGGFRNSFSALRRYNKFLDAIQLDFSIYFSGKDRETNFGVEKFVFRIEQLRRNPNSSARSLSNAIKHSDTPIIVFGNLISVVVLFAVSGIPLVFFVLLAAVLVLNVLGARFIARSRRYQQRLLKAISECKSGGGA